MKPVAIFRFSAEDGPGYFASFLDRHSVPWEVFKLDEGASVPTNANDYAGLVFMGGPMSVNDDLPWMGAIVELIRIAVATNQPCLGHCLGGQLMCKALGGRVVVNHVKEIGWNKMQAVDSALARAWLGEGASSRTTFQWHGETFSIPVGAERILTSEACMNQAFVIGNSLGMQCHTEMTPAMIEEWCRDWAAEDADATLASIQTAEEMQAMMPENIAQLTCLADQLYGKWLEGVSRESC